MAVTAEPANAVPGSEPKFRHEFVGMMFAVTIGEVGLQTAGLVHLVQSHDVLRFLPAVSHLVLATAVITASWVGWTLSRAPGGQRDVRGVFEWEFLVLLTDIALVITYFILVRTVDFGKEEHPRIDPPSIVALWVIWIFSLYLFWDFLTKVCMLRKRPQTSKRETLMRIIPTVTCLGLALVVRALVANADYSHWVTSDLALLSLVLLFRALKAGWLRRSSLICGLGFIGALLWTVLRWATPWPNSL